VCFSSEVNLLWVFARLCLASSLVRTYIDAVDDVTTAHSKRLSKVLLSSYSTCASASFVSPLFKFLSDHHLRHSEL
jgi:hypothetical protein